MTLLMFAAGLIMLVVGAEALVRGASKLARAVGLSPLIIGLTIVAFGTSAPEMAVSVLAGLAGNADISLGNVVGSNIFNVLLILGVSSVITPLIVSTQLVRLDVPIMVAASFLTWILGADGKIGHSDGILLFAGIILYTAFLVYQGRRESKEAPENKEPTSNDQKSFLEGKLLVNIGLIAAGLVLLVWGSNWLVRGAVSIAEYLGVSQLLIGLTVVAAGTSLPEVATSVVAAIHGERDIAVGNVVGSNIFNIMAVLGMSAIVAAKGITISDVALRFDIPIMTAVAVACLPIFFTGNVISRWEGGLFLGYYLAYTLYLILSATHNDMLPLFGRAMLWFVIPITVITLLVVLVRPIRTRKKVQES
ncbi:MAG: calcium/sodium antiporter [Desulfobacterales bacterium]|nr:MAG: calcium/sodium antiporter [Desulfobacterales bacterium]